MDKGAPSMRILAAHDLIFQPRVADSPWWQSITAEHKEDDGGRAPGHWGYRLVSGNPHGNGMLVESIGYDEVNNMIRTVATGTYNDSLRRSGTAPSDKCRQACKRFVGDPATAGFTPGQADEVLQMIMFGEVLFSLVDEDRTT